MTIFRRRRILTPEETREEHEKIVQRLEGVEELATKNAKRLKRLELEVGIFKPGPIVDGDEEDVLDGG